MIRSVLVTCIALAASLAGAQHKYLPPDASNSFGPELHVQTGDVAAVVYGSKMVYALVADEGPKCKIGEGSIALHEALGHTVCKQRNSKGECTKIRDTGIPSNVLYFIFSNSKGRIFPGLSPENVNDRIKTEGQKLFSELTTTAGSP